MTLLDDLLTDVGAELDRLSALHSGPLEPPHGSSRRTLVSAAVVVMLVATGLGVYTIARRGTTNAPVPPSESAVTATTATPPPSTSAPSPSTTATSLGVDSSALSRTITIGSAGPDVTRLQQRLTDLGFALGPVDGLFGAATQQAVWAFKKLVGGISYEELFNDPHAGDVTDQLWAQMTQPVTIEPRRPDASGTHVEVYLPLQVLVVFTDNRPVLIAHISSGELDARGQPVEWCERITHDADNEGQPLPQPITSSVCAASKTPGGVFTATRVFEGQEITDLGGMYNPVFFNYGLAIHGALIIPLEPVSHGPVRINNEVADIFPTLVHVGDTIYVWGHDGRQPENYTRQESLPSFASTDPTPTTTGV
jgi:peptidoglycan hydrolase-like protein with peptidoglycan-binding domain